MYKSKYPLPVAQPTAFHNFHFSFSCFMSCKQHRFPTYLQVKISAFLLMMMMKDELTLA